MQNRILIIDDETQIVKALDRYFSDIGFEVKIALSVDEASQLLEKDFFDVALIDLKIKDKSGLDLITHIKEIQPDVICIMMTGFATLESAIEAIKLGAYHYLTKPFRLEDVENLVHKSLSSKKLERENQYLKQQLSLKQSQSIKGSSEPIQKIYQMIEKVASTDSTILILGESGTGKELVARAIHQQSSRKDKAWVAVNCGAIPEELLESELFGHIKGAFTGASSTRMGRFQAADGGTLFLDEIGEMSLRLQVKLLRVLQEKKFEPVGSNRTVQVDVRIIAATNQNLEEAVKQKKFREDLYYRLHVIPITLPALRERLSDLHILSDYFLKKFADENGKKVPKLSAEVIEKLKKHTWPGNVRELENLMERLVVLCSNEVIQIEDLPPFFNEQNISTEQEIDFPDEGLDFNEKVNHLESELIKKALLKAEGNKNKAALLLNLNRTTLVEKIKKKNL